MTETMFETSEAPWVKSPTDGAGLIKEVQSQTLPSLTLQDRHAVEQMRPLPGYG